MKTGPSFSRSRSLPSSAFDQERVVARPHLLQRNPKVPLHHSLFEKPRDQALEVLVSVRVEEACFGKQRAKGIGIEPPEHRGDVMTLISHSFVQDRRGA